MNVAKNVNLKGSSSSAKVLLDNVGSSNNPNNITFSATGLTSGLYVGDIITQESANITLSSSNDVSIKSIEGKSVSLNTTNLGSKVDIKNGIRTTDYLGVTTGVEGIDLSEAGDRITIDSKATNTIVNLSGNGGSDKFVIETEDYTKDATLTITGDLKSGDDYFKLDATKENNNSLNIDMSGLIVEGGAIIDGGDGDFSLKGTDAMML